MSSQQDEVAAGVSQPATVPEASSPHATAQEPTGRPGTGAFPPPDVAPAMARSAVSGPGRTAGLPDSGRAASGVTPQGSRKPWKEGKDGRTVFRRAAPVVVWWIWVVFALFNLIEVIIPDHDYLSIELAVGALAVTGIAYATALRPRVLAAADGLEVRNPVRDHLIRWGALNGIYLGDAVELSCARTAPRKDKAIYCWALYSGRRNRLKSQQLGLRSWGRPSARRDAAIEPAVEDPAQLMAAELGRRSTEAKAAGPAAATLESRWAWFPIVCIAVPAAALLALLLAR